MAYLPFFFLLAKEWWIQHWPHTNRVSEQERAAYYCVGNLFVVRACPTACSRHKNITRDWLCQTGEGESALAFAYEK